MPAQTQSPQVHPELTAMLTKRFPSESPSQLRDRALKILELSDSLKKALSDFWGNDR
jgi:hypothetical protein